MEEYLDTKVTRINGWFHVRLFNKDTGVIYDEMACSSRVDIGYCIREMLRFHDKLGGTSKMASSSRHRNKSLHKFGRVKYIK